MHNLNAEQQRAAQAGEGPVVIIAGPGTGKTKTLIARILFLLQHGVLAKQILALTFTKKAAEEMRERLAQQLPNAKADDLPVISTFHALCFDIITQKTGRLPQFIDEPARLGIIKNLAKPAVCKGLSVRELSLMISRAKNVADTSEPAIHLANAYNAAMKERGVMDFDDLLVVVRDALMGDTAWQKEIQAKYRYILVDEFQDTNSLQYDVLQLMRGTDNIFVIGDPLQSIYSFRGASSGVFDRFLDDFSLALRITLQANYRSSQAVVRATNAIYPSASKLAAMNTQAGSARCIEVLNEYSEAQFVLNEIQKYVGGTDLQRAISHDSREIQRNFAHFAVLYRNRPVARVLQKMIAESGIPYQIVGEGSPYEQPQVQLVLTALRRLVKKGATATAKDVSVAQIDGLLSGLSVHDKPDVAIEQIATRCNSDAQINIQQLRTVLSRFATIPDALTYIDEIADDNFYDPRAEAVTLLTIHAAKGLEFGHVFLIGTEDGILPSARSEEAEERRLFYVAISRAKESLDILHAQRRSAKPAKISRFVADMAVAAMPQVIDPALQNDLRRAQKRHAKRAQATLF